MSLALLYVELVFSVFSHIRAMVHCAFSSRQLSHDETCDLVSSALLTVGRHFKVQDVDMTLHAEFLVFRAREFCAAAQLAEWWSTDPCTSGMPPG